MELTFDQKLRVLAVTIEKESMQRLFDDNMACQANLDNAKTRIKEGKKYIKINIGGSGKYMVDKEGNIFGIKAYGVIHKGHQYGTLDTINEYNWGGYTATKKQTINT